MFSLHPPIVVGFGLLNGPDRRRLHPILRIFRRIQSVGFPGVPVYLAPRGRKVTPLSLRCLRMVDWLTWLRRASS
jgi:hypothetical protein